MFGALGRLLAALGRLAGSLDGLSGTLEEVNIGLRQRLLLDAPREEPAALPGPDEEAVAPSRRNGKRAVS